MSRHNYVGASTDDDERLALYHQAERPPASWFQPLPAYSSYVPSARIFISTQIFSLLPAYKYSYKPFANHPQPISRMNVVRNQQAYQPASSTSGWTYAVVAGHLSMFWSPPSALRWPHIRSMSSLSLYNFLGRCLFPLSLFSNLRHAALFFGMDPLLFSHSLPVSVFFTWQCESRICVMFHVVLT